MKALTAYFSASGVTKGAAERLAKAAGTDLFEIAPAQPYTRADLNWQDKNSRSTVEMKDPSSRPEIARKLPDMDRYDVVFIGFPVWWYTAPTIIKTFLESYDFSGKTIALFATSGGSGLGKTADDLAPCAKGAKWAEGMMLNRASEADMKKWAEKVMNG